ncbi:MAG: lipid-binding SYLF domain-containing protein [Alphaproteobacteria bacterium]
MKAISRRLPPIVALAALLMLAGTPATASEQQTLVDKARLAVEEIKADSNFSNFPGLLARAKGVIVVPELVKAGFFLGGEGGRGVLLARGPETEAWGYPAFYTLGSGSIGLQFGAQMSQVMFLVVTDGGLEKLISGSVTLGGDANVAVGPVGSGIEAGTTLNVDVDFYAFARTKGAFFGVSLEGAALVPNDEWNTAYYGAAVTPADIVVERKVTNPGADTLRGALGGQ